MSTPPHRRWLLLLLLVVLAFNYVDRLVLGLVLLDIKADLRLSDTQLGLLSGIAFSLFYATMGIPLARWADRGDRVRIIALTTALWSVLVAACGAVQSFVQLLLIRVGVAVGEAGCIPPAQSLIASYFNRAERPRALAIYMLGGPLSMFIGYFCAGWLNQIYGWRMTFVLLGLPGVALALLVLFTLRDPRRGGIHDARVQERSVRETAANPPATWREIWNLLSRNGAYKHIVLYFSVFYFFGYGITQWKPAFFMRSFDMQTGELGTWLALIYGLGGLIGTYLGGAWATRYAGGNERAQLLVSAISFAAFGLLGSSVYLASDRYVALGLMFFATIGITAVNGPLFATLQSLVDDRLRATAVAVVYFFANLIGLGLGPLAAGAMSDAFASWAGDESLRYALLAMSPGYVWGAWHIWRASRHIARKPAENDGLDAGEDGAAEVRGVPP